MEFEVVCNTIAPASNPAGKRFVMVNFGVEQDVTRAQATTGVPALWDNRATLFIPEDIWKTLSKKFTVGEAFALTIASDRIELRKK